MFSWSRRDRASLYRLIVATVLAVPAIAVPVVAQEDDRNTAGTARALTGTVTVVPFSNISGAVSDDWIGYGIAETVSANLEQLDALSVISRAAVPDILSLDPAITDDAATIARYLRREIGIGWVVTGGYQRFGDQIRITARVLNTETVRIESVLRIDGAIYDIFALQDQLATEIVAGVHSLASGDSATARKLPYLEPTAPNDNGSLGSRPLESSAVSGAIALGVPDEVAGFGIAEDAGILSGRPTARPPRATEPPRIDGRLDDALWRSALHVNELVQQNPVEGAPATEPTDLWLAYDNQNIYIAVHAHYADPAIMRANRVDRDQAFEDDNIVVYFDTFLDQQRAYRFSVNGYGVQGDAVVNARGYSRRGRRRRTGGSYSRGGIPTGDPSWDALFDSAGQIVDDGYTVELAIPFKSLRYPRRNRGIQHRWGFQFVREVRGKDEYQVWAPVTRSVSGFLTQVGVLEGMTNLSLSRNLEIMPTFTTAQFGSLNGQGNFIDGDPSTEGGVNVKYGITSNLTADFTYNPDFSQIESDLPQIEVNQRYALFYPELRPFFLEGSEIFSPSPGLVTFVNTRTIVDPEFGGKITGKLGNITIGLMVANDEAPGRRDSSSDGAFGEKASNFVGRVRYDLYAESFVGAIFTHRGFMDSHSSLGGLDGNFRLGQTQSLSFKAVQTDHRDLSGVDREGQMFNLSWRLNSRHWNGFLSLYTLSPNFRTDVGFVRRVDQKRGYSRIGYRFWPESWVVNWGPSLQYSWNHNFKNVLEDEEIRAGFDATFARNISVNASFRDEIERFGGINFKKQAISLGGTVNTNRRLAVGGYYRYGDEVRYNDNPFLGQGSTGSFFATVRPFSRLQSEVGLSTSDFIDSRTGEELLFDVKILRTLSTYQLSDRFMLRSIAEFNTFEETIGMNWLLYLSLKCRDSVLCRLR